MPIRLVTISGPRGAGKSTIQAELLGRIHGLRRIVPHTTRQPRLGEQNGVHYHFVSESEFDRLVSEGKFVWWDRVGPTQRSGTIVDEFLVSEDGSVVDVLPSGARTMRDRIAQMGGKSFSIALFAREDLRRIRIAARQPGISELQIDQLMAGDPVSPRMTDYVGLGFELLLTNEGEVSRTSGVVCRDVRTFLAR